MFINYSSLLQLCFTYTLCRAGQSMLHITNSDDSSDGEGGNPLCYGLKQIKFLSTVWTAMIHTTLLCSLLTSHFSKGWGSLGRSATQKSLVMKRCGYQTQKGQSEGTESTQRHRKDKTANIPQQNFPNTFRILLTKHNVNLVSNLTSPPKPHMDWLWFPQLTVTWEARWGLPFTKPIKLHIYYSHSSEVDTKTHTKYHFFFPPLFKTASEVKPGRLRLFRMQGTTTPFTRKRLLIKQPWE